ncbi:MAG TPA: antibiotic biosynthesis monooxygenase [Gaiellaceae bacterium]|nr:antibiotic biosynthesis monooxygenase [Gaiellaceae bacterium]
MIARIWRGWTRPEDAEAYAAYMEEVAAPESLGTPGNRGFSVLHRRDGEREEFLTISLWDSLEAIEAFAGDEIEQAVFYPEDERYLVERELTVGHFEYLEPATGTGPAPAA